MNGKYVAAVRTDAWTASTEAVRDGGELASALLCFLTVEDKVLKFYLQSVSQSGFYL